MPIIFYVLGLVLVATHGQIVSDKIVDRANAADDWGHIVHDLPDYVLYPTNDTEVQQAIKFARTRMYKITVRGTGHAVRGQAQCLKCVVIDMSRMTAVRGVNSNWVEIEGGAQNRVALDALRPLGLTTPVQPDWQGIASGGFLSVSSGLGPANFKSSTISENILQLTVVTGNGDIVTTSRTANPELFDAVRSGMGQFGVITAVRYKVIPLPGTRARVYHVYQTLPQMTSSYTKALQDTVNNVVPFQQWETFPAPNVPGGGVGSGYPPTYSLPVPDPWVYIQEYVVFYNEGNEPNNSVLLNYFDHDPSSELTSDMTYYEWIYRLDPVFEFLKTVGAWYDPHPWFEVMLPRGEAFTFINETLIGSNPADLGPFSAQIIIPVKVPVYPGTFQLLPETTAFSHHIYFGLLRTSGTGLLGQRWPEATRLLDVNHKLQLSAIKIGGKPVVSSTLPSNPAEWRAVLGDTRYKAFLKLKRKYDRLELFGSPNWRIL